VYGNVPYTAIVSRLTVPTRLDRDVIKGYPWTTLANLKGDPEVVRALDETEKLLKDLKRALSKS
jgi:hypothetical protein